MKISYILLCTDDTACSVVRLKLYIILSSRLIITKISSIYLPPNHLVAIDRLAAASYQQGIVQIRCVNDLDAYGWDSCGLAVAVEVCAHDASFLLLDNKSKFPATADLPPEGCYHGEVTRCYYGELLLKFYSYSHIYILHSSALNSTQTDMLGKSIGGDFR